MCCCGEADTERKASLRLWRKTDRQTTLDLESFFFFFFDEWNDSFQSRIGSDKRGTNDSGGYNARTEEEVKTDRESSKVTGILRKV